MKNTVFLLLLVLAACESPAPLKQGTVKTKQETTETVQPEVKVYAVGNMKFSFAAPSGFKNRQDQFEQTRKKTSDQINSNDKGAASSANDNILVSLGRSDTSDVNVLLISERPNTMISKFGLADYRDKVIEMFEYKFEKDSVKHNSFSESRVIDGITFEKVLINIFEDNGNYIYSNMMYIGEVDHREFSFSAVYDNSEDGELILNAILNSKFEK